MKVSVPTTAILSFLRDVGVFLKFSVTQKFSNYFQARVSSEILLFYGYTK